MRACVCVCIVFVKMHVETMKSGKIVCAKQALGPKCGCNGQCDDVEQVSLVGGTASPTPEPTNRPGGGAGGGGGGSGGGATPAPTLAGTQGSTEYVYSGKTVEKGKDAKSAIGIPMLYFALALMVLAFCCVLVLRFGAQQLCLPAKPSEKGGQGSRATKNKNKTGAGLHRSAEKNLSDNIDHVNATHTNTGDGDRDGDVHNEAGMKNVSV